MMFSPSSLRRYTGVAVLACILLILFAAVVQAQATPQPLEEAPPYDPADIPPPSELPVTALGRSLYAENCAPCHGEAGDAQGPVAHRVAGLGVNSMVPPTFHDDRLRTIPDGQVFATITHGIRNMPAYAQSIPTDDRWAIVTYVRALQLSEQGRPSRPE